MRKLLGVAMMVGGLSLATATAGSAVYDAAKDFSLSGNPNGVWTYGQTPTVGGTFTVFPKSATGPMESNAGTVQRWNTGAGSWEAYHAAFANKSTAPVTVSAGLILQPGALVLHPASKGAQAVARFTAPDAGTYTISAVFTTLDAQAKKTEAAVVVAGGVMLQKPLSGAGAKAEFSQLVTLNKGATVDFVVGNGGDGFADDAVGLNATVTPATSGLEGWYKMKTQFQGDGKCLEGNQAGSTVKGGAAFMDSCQNVTGQSWKLVPEGGYYRLKTQFQGDNKCLEGNEAGSTVKGGAAFMDDCKNVTGQLWRVVPEGGYYRLKTQFQGDGKCLEGNQAASTVKDGAAFMDSCQNVTGQMWKLEKL